LDELIDTLRRLRGEQGCPWDRSRTLPDLCGYLIEEAYELQETADLVDRDAAADELGDVLFMALSCVLYLEEHGGADLGNIAARARDKVVRRHPHVFGDRVARDAAEGAQRWQEMKDAEARARGEDPPPYLGTLPRAMPALRRALAIQRKVAEVGFEWETADQVYAKLLEESRELQEVLSLGDARRMQDELGDMLFSVVNLARFLGVDPEAALAGTLQKFVERFGYVERRLREQGRELRGATLEEMDKLWEEAKRGGRGPGPSPAAPQDRE
jgi:tetrapyrrole methylase family protein/MazG family protein